MNAHRREFLTAASMAVLSAGAGCADLLDGETGDSGGSDDTTGEDDAETDESDETDAWGTDIPAEDWPSFQRTARNSGYAPASAPTEDPAERWSRTFSGSLRAQVAVVDGTVYVATNDGIVHALEAESGDEIWTESLEGGRSQCPCVVDGLVVVGTDAGELVALDASDGSPEWTTELAGPVAGPTAADGTVYVGTREEPMAYAIDAAEGDELWSTPLEVDAVDYPAVDENAVYVGAQDGFDGRVYAIEATEASDRWVAEGIRMQPPTVTESGVLAPYETIERLRADGSTDHHIGIMGVVLASPAATPELVVYGADNGIVGATGHDRRSTDEGWGNSVGEYVISAPAVTDDAVYATMIGPELYALDVETGDVLWSRSLEGSRPTAPTVADGAVFVCTSDGRLVAFD